MAAIPVQSQKIAYTDDFLRGCTKNGEVEGIIGCSVAEGGARSGKSVSSILAALVCLVDGGLEDDELLRQISEEQCP